MNAFTRAYGQIEREAVANSINRVILIGNLGSDPEIRSMQGGDRFANLSLATSESWRDKVSGEQRERAMWHRVVIYNAHQVAIAERYLSKGSKVYIEGSLHTRKWQDKSGKDQSVKDHYSTEIVITRFRGNLVMLDGAAHSDTADASANAATAAAGHGDVIPF